jgi:hypothetical protein
MSYALVMYIPVLLVFAIVDGVAVVQPVVVGDAIALMALTLSVSGYYALTCNPLIMQKN